MIETGATLGKPAAPARKRYTHAELVAQLPETTLPCELWDGELSMSPAPSFFHQEVVLRFYRQLHDWVAVRKLGKVVTAPVDMVLSPHRVTQPDILFISEARLNIVSTVINGPVDLAAEVISLGQRQRDRIEKRDLYEQYGIREFWLIDPEASTVEVFHLENGRYQLVMRCTPGQAAASRLLPGFEVSVTGLFQPS
jgi:Uma2 family endonuclease